MIYWIIVAFILDLLIGDPYSWPHPIKLIGNFIAWFQERFTQTKSDQENYRLGILLWLVTVFGSGLVTFILLKLSFLIHPVIGIVCYIYLSYTTLATRSLSLEGKKVYQKLVNDSLDNARKQVAMIVGRDTKELTKDEIIKATIETIAENTSDGVIAPLLCLFLGGPTLAMMYKAVNTLDSMVGYVTPKYRAIQLGGTHLYHGVEIYKPTIGVSLRSAKPKDILTANKLLYTTAILSVTVFSVTAIIIKKYFL